MSHEQDNKSSWDDFRNLAKIETDPAEILKRRAAGEIYCADFRSGQGKYISATVDDETHDAKLYISPNVEVRLTYIFQDEEVKGISLKKIGRNGSVHEFNLSTMKWKGVLSLLHLFSNLDLGAIAHRSLFLNQPLSKDANELQRFIDTLASDPQGREKMKEVLKNIGTLESGDIDVLSERKSSIHAFNNILTNDEEFKSYKEYLEVKKDEEVWQKFFESNHWILGADCVEILPERVIDEDNISDLPFKDYDGFVNIVELKLSKEPVWTSDSAPSSQLTRAVMQCAKYITELERRMNDEKKKRKLNATILKPKITLLYGRSNHWSEDDFERFKVLNSSFHDISILTYDHVLKRAQNILGVNGV